MIPYQLSFNLLPFKEKEMKEKNKKYVQERRTGKREKKRKHYCRSSLNHSSYLFLVYLAMLSSIAQNA
jgi:hypothetical protein